MANKYALVAVMFFLLCFWGCVKPFTPTVTTTNYNYLVVEGLINLTDSTIIKLSRTVTLGSTSATKVELKAVVTVESSTGTSYALKELGNGQYAAPSLNLTTAYNYRLRIKTATGGTYLSDFVTATPSPPIDSVSWTATNNLNIFVSTHDPNNATHYYRWDYSEEWEFNSDYDSQWVSNGLNIVARTAAQAVHHCYGGDTSHLINLSSSAGLSQDVISQFQINTVLASAEKLGIKYSIQVKQYALTKDAYDYWTLLKKNTENLGSIFDSQPSASIGNIHNVNNAAEPVIGYMSVGTITSKRIFITKSQLPGSWITIPAYPITFSQCQLDTLIYAKLGAGNPPDTVEFPQKEFINYKQPQFLGYRTQLIPITQASTAATLLSHPAYVASAPFCVDCTLRGSVNKPSYWQ